MSRFVPISHQTERCLRWRSAGPQLLAAFLLVAAPQFAQADLVKLMNGGELRGKILPSSESKQRIRIETLSGAVVVVERDQTQFVTMRSLTVEDYETRLKHVENQWEAHWELSEWCRQHGLTKQRETHLLRVTELSPEHEKAQVALGRVWHKAKWVDRDQLMASQGYVKYKNKYITHQELEVIEKSTDELERERSWFQKIRLWHGWLNSSSDDRQRKAVNELTALTDPHAASAVLKFLSADSRVEVRELSIAVLVKISGNKATAGLAKIALFDESPQIRSTALTGIGTDDIPHAQATFVKALKNEFNAVVCRAATALGEMGDKSTIAPLINALVTVHAYHVDVPLNQAVGFSTDGNFASNSQSLPPSVVAAMRSGQMLPPIVVPSTDPVPKKAVTVHVDHYNAEVLAALEKLTNQNFGYDKRTWNLWWAAEKNVGSKSPK